MSAFSSLVRREHAAARAYDSLLDMGAITCWRLHWDTGVEHGPLTAAQHADALGIRAVDEGAARNALRLRRILGVPV